MDVHRIERLTRDLIVSDAFPFELIAVGHHQLVVRGSDNRLINIDLPEIAAPATFRDFVRRRLEAEC